MVKAVSVMMVAAVMAGLFSGCATSGYEIRQLETTFLNQETGSEYTQKNAVLIDTANGKTWVFSSDENSNYRWVRVPVVDPVSDETN